VTLTCPWCHVSVEPVASTLPHVPHFKCHGCGRYYVEGHEKLMECGAPVSHIREVQSGAGGYSVAAAAAAGAAPWGRMI